MNPLSSDQIADVLRVANLRAAEVPCGSTPLIEAIKLARAMTGGGLKETKDLVEALIAAQPKSDLLNRIRGDLPGLLRRGTPVRNKSNGWLGYVWSVHPATSEANVCYCLCGATPTPITNLEMDLGNATARCHLAWWVRANTDTGNVFGALVAVEHVALRKAVYNEPMTPDQIDTLARIALRLAERT